MAINAPTYFFHKLNSFRELIVKVLKDPKKEIRFAAIAALRASLTIVAQRETNIHNVHGSHDEENETKRYYRVCYTLNALSLAHLFNSETFKFLKLGEYND